MDNVFTTSLFYKPPTILGKQLLPLTLGHVVLLDTMENPLLKIGKGTLKDVIAAIWICTQDYRCACDTISKMAKDNSYSNKIIKMISKWSFKHSLKESVESCNTFIEYMTHYTNCPEFWGGKNVKKMKSPWHYALATSLMKELHITDVEVWNMPLDKAFSYYGVLAEMNGVDLRDDELQPIQDVRIVQ